MPGLESFNEIIEYKKIIQSHWQITTIVNCSCELQIFAIINFSPFEPLTTITGLDASFKVVRHADDQPIGTSFQEHIA